MHSSLSLQLKVELIQELLYAVDLIAFHLLRKKLVSYLCNHCSKIPLPLQGVNLTETYWNMVCTTLRISEDVPASTVPSFFPKRSLSTARI